jgi:electron transfer flavoprotein alpha subunit
MLMESILFLAHSEPDCSLTSSALETLNAACSLANSLPKAKLAVGIIGERVQPAFDNISGCGASQWFAVEGADFAQPRYGTDAAAAEAICKAAQATLVLAPHTSRWGRVAAGVAKRAGGRADTHVTNLAATEKGIAATRWYYRQRMEAVIHRSNRPWFVLLEPGIYPAWSGAKGTAKYETISVALTEKNLRTTVIGLRQPATDVQTIRPEANLLLVAGAGWTKKQADGQTHLKDAEKLLSDCLKVTRASLGSSKSLVDLGGEGQEVLSFLTHLNQIGQTGSTPRHPKGLATCCHGEEPHTVGWRFINERRAVNLDPNCGWARGKADVVYVADAFQVIEKVNQMLAGREGH